MRTQELKNYRLQELRWPIADGEANEANEQKKRDEDEEKSADGFPSYSYFLRLYFIFIYGIPDMILQTYQLTLLA